MKHIGLFEGIGGFSLAARWMGWDTVAWCEWDEMCQRHLRYHFPEAEGFGDITKTDFTKYADTIDLLTGGFPCQPFSTAGKRQGTADTRYLWPEMLRAIREIRPRWIVGENVRGLVNWDGGMVFDTVQADLETEGYEVLPFLLPACAVDATHRRDRIWFVAKNTDQNGRRSIQRESQARERKQRNSGTGNYERIRAYNEEIRNAPHPPNKRQQLSGETRTGRAGFENGYFGNDAAYTNGKRLRGEGYGLRISGFACEDGARNDWQNFPTQPPVCGGNDGLPSELDGTTFSKWRQWSIKSYGNAVVPQVVYQIYKAIQQYEN